jgi:hypothetical protein
MAEHGFAFGAIACRVLSTFAIFLAPIGGSKLYTDRDIASSDSDE